MVIRDWLPFAVVLLLYDISRGAAKLIGTPTMWQPQIDWDRWLFFGTVPTVWLQERLSRPYRAVVGSLDQHGVHVVFHPPLRRGRRALAAQSRRLEGVRSAIRRVVIHRAGDLHRVSRRAAVGRRPVHTC